MKRATLSVVFGCFIVLLSCSNIQSANDVPRISKEELKARVGSSSLMLIDVRTRGDWERSDKKIAGAVRKEPDSVDVWAGTLPKDKEIVLYCA